MDEKLYPFQGEMLYDLPAMREINRGSLLFQPRVYIPRLLFGIALVYNLVVQAIFSPDSSLSFIFLVLCASFFLSQLIVFFSTRNGGIHYKRMLSANNGQPTHQFISFDLTGIYVSNPDNGSNVVYRYEQIRSLAQTQNFFVLLLEYNQFLVVRKDRITGGSYQELANYLIPICPKLKPRKIRDCLPGRIVNWVVLVIWTLSMLLVLYRLPAVQNWIESTRPINNSMSYQEIADALEPMGIHIDEETITELEEFYASYDFEFYGSGYSKTLDLLCYAGYGTIDENTWEWTPSDSGVYWFDMEVWDINAMYSDFLRGVSALDPEELDFANIQEDLSRVNWDTGSGTQSASFDWNGQTFCIGGQVDYDWFDPQAGDDLSKIVAAQTGKQLYFAYDEGQGFLVFYGTQEWAKQFKAMTGINLTSSMRLSWY